MKRLLDALFGRPICDDPLICHDTTAAERRHERAVRQSLWTMRRADRSIRQAFQELRESEPAWEELLNKTGKEGRR